MSQFSFNVCTQIKTGSTDGRKQVAGDDVTIKHSTLANSFDSFKHRNVIKDSSTYIGSAKIWENKVLKMHLNTMYLNTVLTKVFTIVFVFGKFIIFVFVFKYYAMYLDPSLVVYGCIIMLNT